ncbi:MAG: GNAT family N-acetyltransferase [Oscillospiraceae bacterium]|nr:GNAT family N-acetyltransferase [Oscillospiraceae bacterium]
MLPKVRTFTAADTEAVSSIFIDIPDGWSKKALEESLANDSIKSFVLEDMGKVVAFASYLVADDAELVFIVTDKAKLRKGYGKILLSETLNSLNLPCVLEVRESNTPAIKLYQSFGFELLGKRKNFYSNPTETALIYKREV